LHLFADAGGQALGEHADDGRGDHVGLDADLHQADDGLRGGVGVQRGEHEVAGERGLGGDLGGLQVADLADQDDVGILAQEGAQQGGELQVDVGVDLALADARQLDLDRILDGGDVDLRGG
jgi:hypothetical protein